MLNLVESENIYIRLMILWGLGKPILLKFMIYMFKNMFTLSFIEQLGAFRMSTSYKISYYCWVFESLQALDDFQSTAEFLFKFGERCFLFIHFVQNI